jgi:hypothetical protein
MEDGECHEDSPKVGEGGNAQWPRIVNAYFKGCGKWKWNGEEIRTAYFRVRASADGGDGAMIMEPIPCNPPDTDSGLSVVIDREMEERIG